MKMRFMIFCGVLFLSLFFILPANVFPITVHDFRVNTDSAVGIAQYYVDIAFDSLGNFVVAYTDRGYNHDFRKVFFQRYDSLANRLGEPVLVSDTTIPYNDIPRIAMHSSGSFAITWSVGIPDPNINFILDIHLRRYDSSGNALGEAQKVDVDRYDTLGNGDFESEIAMDKDGNFVVVWMSQEDGVGTMIFGQLFSASGERVGNNFFISDPNACDYPIANFGDFPRVAYNSQGYFFVCWKGYYHPPGHHSENWPMARVYNPAGEPVSKVFLIFLPDSEWDYGNHIDVASNSQDNFVTAFSVNDTLWTYPNNAVGVRTFDTLGNPLNEIRIANDVTDLRDIWWMARVAVDGSDGYVVLWSDSRDGRNLWAQRFDSLDDPQGANYRINIPPNSLATPSGYNRFMWNLDIHKNTVGFAWVDYRNYETYNADIYAKLLDLDVIGFYLLGDVVMDGIVNLSDLIYLINYLYRGGPAPLPQWVGDVTSDGEINIGDLVYLINYLFRDGPPPQKKDLK